MRTSNIDLYKCRLKQKTWKKSRYFPHNPCYQCHLHWHDAVCKRLFCKQCLQITLELFYKDTDKILLHVVSVPGLRLLRSLIALISTFLRNLLRKPTSKMQLRYHFWHKTSTEGLGSEVPSPFGPWRKVSWAGLRFGRGSTVPILVLGLWHKVYQHGVEPNKPFCRYKF